MTAAVPARGETETIAIAAPPAAVLAVIADARRLPEWAPGFATAVTPEDGLWRIDQGDGATFLIDVAVHADAGTVDLLRPGGGPSFGARLRALPSGTGTELLFTILFPPGVPDDAVAAQMAVVAEELRTVRTLAEVEVDAEAM
jgi:polyketide cyclase/dehydrase/lipid transport protein